MLANCKRLGAICQERSLLTTFNEIVFLSRHRHFSDTHFNATGSEIEYVIEQNLVGNFEQIAKPRHPRHSLPTHTPPNLPPSVFPQYV